MKKKTMETKDTKRWDAAVRDKFSAIVADAYAGTGTKGIEKQHALKKLTARERIELLFDRGSFQELNLLSVSRQQNLFVQKKHYYGDGIIVGYGLVKGKTVFAVSSDATISGGAGGEEYVYKICRCLEKAIEVKVPFISLNESGGARIEEGIDSLAAYSELFRLNTEASGYIPQIAAIMGNCAGGASYSPILHDFIFMTRASQMYITGPQVIKALTGETITMEALGGAEIHGKVNGQAHFIYDDDRTCIQGIRKLLEYLPSNCNASPQMEKNSGFQEKEVRSDIEAVVPSNNRKPYDVKKVIELVFDEGSFLEVQKDFASNICVGFAKLQERVAGVVANQPNVLGGALDCDSADKASRFVRFCDCFNIPIITLVDVPAFLPGIQQERKGIIRHGAKILYSYAEATVPKISVIMRKAYGGAYCAMNSKNLGADIVYAWPICELAVMGADGAVNVICRKQIDSAENQEKERQRLIEQYNEAYLNPYFAASRALVDEVISPEQTREKLIAALQMLRDKEVFSYRKKHGNMPL